MKRSLDVAFAAKVWLLRITGAVDFPVPPNHSLRATSSVTVRHYYESGLTTLMPIVTAATVFGADFDQPLRVLDFGCGVGRQLLHLTRLFPKAMVYGCDVNHDSVNYIAKTFPMVKAMVNSFDPPLNYEADQFDVIYSVSTFSHFSETDALIWLQELRRVCKPGGLICLTFNGATSLDRSHARGARLHYSADALEADGIWFDADETAFQGAKRAEAISEFSSTVIGITRLYGETHYSAAKFKEMAEQQRFQVLTVLPGIIDRYQDLIILRRLNGAQD